jgi:hypothetical protein
MMHFKKNVFLKVLMMIYLLPNSSVDFVSDSLKEAGEQQMMIVVLALPPSDSCKILVSLESRYGMWDFCNKNIYVTHGA